ncbi:DNA-3-methyladenine glycosylase [Marinifilum caeruleilacunae]|uniref:Putative 3-methyladenine DNA glycosylase n=1 Tax=Marinifilum caeruleilacunae TaxID=2499076 RepID=A0ABX1WZY0_9BACT|nr:DNA-3-methyladenine glycosylase [Marinifilum caeruleilacunae]NOU61694.1 DNA-3-methyladenine glycosylase [Marinifilum caeruleilacunae]
MSTKLKADFFQRDIMLVAEELPGKLLVRKTDDGKTETYRITDIEMYIGEEDLACHASKGRTARTEVMYERGGLVYVYLIYGMYWLLNIVTGLKNQPQAILIRGVEKIDGPGRVGRSLQLDKSFYGEDLSKSNRIWIEDDGSPSDFTCHPRINIDYAGEIWKKKLFRYVLK